MAQSYDAPDIPTEMALRQSGATQNEFVDFQTIRNLPGSADSSFTFGTHALRPASGALGDRYFETDRHWLYYWAGTAWKFVAGVDYGTDAVRAAIIVTANDDGATFITTDTGIWWQVSSGVWARREDTTVTPGSYTSANITVDQQGRITSAANGIGSGGTVTHTLGALTSGQLIKGNGGDDVTVGDLTGDVTTSGGMATTIGAGKVTNAMLAGSIDLATKVTGTLPATSLPGFTGDVQATAGSNALTLANIPTGTPAVGTILHTNIAAPSTPAAGKVAVYSDSTDLRLHDKNASGTIGTTVVADAGASNNFLTAISAAGIISKAQPSFSNISGTATSSQLPTALANQTSINGLAITGSTGTLTIGNGKTLSVSNTLTLTATDGSTLAIGAGGTLASAAYVATGTSGATIPLLNAANTWSGIQTHSVAIKTTGGSFTTASGFGQVYYDSAEGLTMYGQGSTYDFGLLNKNGGSVIENPTGTTNVLMASLAGTGSRNVVASSTGVLSAPVSDARLKTNVRPISSEMDVLAKLKTLTGVYFDYDQAKGVDLDLGRQVGMIAQDVEKIFPEMVGVNKGSDKDGYKYLRYELMVAYLVEVAKAQQTMIESLR